MSVVCCDYRFFFMLRDALGSSPKAVTDRNGLSYELHCGLYIVTQKLLVSVSLLLPPREKRDDKEDFSKLLMSVSSCALFPQDGRDYRWLEHGTSAALTYRSPLRAISGHLINCGIGNIPGVLWD